MARKPEFVVNAAEANSARVNVRVAVNAAAIRREQHNGREHLVVPSFTLPDNVVMNNGLYPKEEIDKAYAGLEGTLAPFSHPMVDGDYVSARQPEAINAYHIGAWNRNVKRVGNRVSIEKWVDLEFAKNTEGGRALLEAIDKGEPIHTSTGIFLDREMTPNAEGYGWIARNMQFDHDAILIGETGAATPEDGVGMMVNKTFVINSVVANESALDDNSYGARMELIDAAVKERYATGDSYAFPMDFDDEAVVVKTADRTFKVRYSLEDGNPILGEEVGEVVQKTEYEMKTNRLKGWFQSLIQWNTKQNEQPLPAIEPEEVNDMKPEELQAALDAQAEKLQGAFNTALAASEAKGQAAISALTAQLQANADSALKDKRAAVAAVHGEVVANVLSGDALDAMFASVQTAAGIVGGAPATNSAEPKIPTMAEHFGGAN